MKGFTKILLKIADIIELYIPMLLFSIVFIFYLIMIAYRYIFLKQISQIHELSQILYMSCAMLAASYGGRTDKHVVFPILYDICSEKLQLIFRIIGNLIVVVISVLLIGPTWESIRYIARKKTFLLKIPFDLINFPFLIFIVLMMIHYLIRMVKDIRLLGVSGIKVRENKSC